MERLTIPYSQCTCREEAYTLVKQKIPELLSQWKIAADVHPRDDSHQIHASGKGFTMDITFEEARAVATITLSFPLTALKSRILTPLKEEFVKYL